MWRVSFEKLTSSEQNYNYTTIRWCASTLAIGSSNCAFNLFLLVLASTMFALLLDHEDYFTTYCATRVHCVPISLFYLKTIGLY